MITINSNGIREMVAQPSHATGWFSLGAFQFYAIVLILGWLVYGGLHWLFHTLGGSMQ